MKDANANEGKKTCELLRQVAVWHLQTHTVPDYFRKCYSTIQLGQLKETIATKGTSDNALYELLR